MTSQDNLHKECVFMAIYGKIRPVLALSAAVVLGLTACTFGGDARVPEKEVLTWQTWSGFDDFLGLVQEQYPDIALDFISYTGANKTGYSWEQMKHDDISDIFITSQILHEEMAKERLLDLSGYEFVNQFPHGILDQVSIDGGIYLLPVNYSMYGIYYNKTLMEEKGWELPSNITELEALCEEIREEGMIPGVIGTQLTGNTFSAVFNLAKTDWLTTPTGMTWEQDFLEGNATAAGMWEGTMAYVKRYIDMGMFTTDPEDRNNPDVLLDYLGNRKSVFCTMVLPVNITKLPDTGDELGMMPYISEDGSKNIYMYSPSCYVGLSKRLAEPGNEKKLENAVRLLSLLYSAQGQEMFITQETPCVLSLLDGSGVPETSMIYDAQQALREGRAFPMTYAGWENVLADMGQAYKEWFRGENGMDGPGCIARMDALQQSSLNNPQENVFCKAVTDFSVEETAVLLGKALGSAAGVDAVIIPIGGYREGGLELKTGVTGKLYAGEIDTEKVQMILPNVSGKYAVMTMTGKQAEELVETGFDALGEGQEPYPYILVTRGDKELKGDTSYQIAFLIEGYTPEVGQNYDVQVREGSLKEFLCTWLEEQKTVSPAGNPWN